MKKSFRKTVLRTIRSTKSRFLAIFAIVALGSGFLAGVLASPLDMRTSADDYCDAGNMFDLRVVSTLGLTDEDLEALGRLEGVEALSPAYDQDLVMLSEEGDSHTTRLHSLPLEGWGDINTPILYEGRLPEKAGECAVVLTQSFGGESQWVGQTLWPEEENQDLPREFTVVGTVKTPVYLSLESERSTAGTGSLDLKLYVPAKSFSQDYYTAAYITLKDAKALNAFEEEYKDLVKAMEDQLEPLGEERAALRYEGIVADGEKELADARREYEDAKAEAEEELADAEKKLRDGEQEIADNEKKLADAKTELENGRKELEDGRAQYQSETASARQQIADGRARINSAQAQIDSGRSQLNAAQTQLTQGYAQLDQGDAQLAQAKAQLDGTQAQLDALDQGKAALNQAAQQMGLPAADSDSAALDLIAQIEQLAPDAAGPFAQLKQGLQALAAQGMDSAGARQALEAGLAEYRQNYEKAQASRAELDKNQAQLNAQKSRLDSSEAQLSAQKSQLNSSEAALQQAAQTAEAEFAQGEKELADGQKEYDEGLAKLEEAKEELEEGWADYRKGKAEAEEELADAEEKLRDAEEELAGIEEGEWYIFTRDDNASFSSYASNADKIAAIARVFPVFFFLVAALVALTTMTRMVEEERQQVGTLKALGYSPAQIAAKYLLYAALASLLGCAAGVAAGMWLFPTVIINAYNIMYDLPRSLTPFRWPLALFSALTATLCTLAATLNACWSALREAPARLMLPKAPKAGKRILLEHITPLWSRLKFTQKVTCRNLFRYKKRFFMTVTGIAGCTALLVTGFGIRDSVSDIVGLQYGELANYQLVVGLGSQEALEDPGLGAILADKSRVEDSLAVLQNSGSVVPQQESPKDDITIFVSSDPARLPEFFRFRHRGGEDIAYDENSVIVTEKLAERQNLKAGDVLTVQNQAGEGAAFTITDICENYVYHWLYISPAAWEEAFGEPAEMNSLLCRFPEGGPQGGEEALTTELLKCEDVAMTSSTVQLSESFQNSIQSINYIVVVLIVSAGALAFVVLYNLTNINITEREKELATIKVLGFYNGETAAYIYRETGALTAIGTACGLGLGVVLHQFVIRTAEIDMIMFGRAIYAPSYLFAAVLTVVFSVLVNLVMYRKLAGISTVASMKAPE